jgi:hypothetical protein
MEEQQDDVLAAEVLVADLEPRPGGRLLRSARLLGAVAAELAWGLLSGPSLSDVVVRRRDDGTEVLRVPAGDPVVPGDQLRHVRSMLQALGPQDFLRAWRHPAD